MLGLSIIASSLIEPLSLVGLFGGFGVIANWIAQRSGFFKLPSLPIDHRRWSFLQCSMCIVIYFINAIFLGPVIFHTICSIDHWGLLEDYKAKLLLLQAVNILLNFILIGTYLSFQRKKDIQALWKDPQMKSKKSYLYDVLMGFFTWFLAFPIVVALGALCEIINEFVFHVQETDQLAVQFLKISSTSFMTLVLAVGIIIIAAPIIEEFIFRGCIQNWLRRKIGVTFAVITTSIIFSFMHFSLSQGASNFPLIISLFTFSLYLGFLYEKTRSLLAPIILHLTFNSISVIRILFN